MRRFWIALLVAGGYIAAPAPLAAQQPTTVDSTYYAFTPILEYMLHPDPIPGASIRLSRVRGDLELPTYSAGVVLVGREWGWAWLNLGIGANRTVGGPVYVGVEAGLLLAPSFPIFFAIPRAHVRLGARLGDVGPIAEIRAGVVGMPSLAVALGFRF